MEQRGLGRLSRTIGEEMNIVISATDDAEAPWNIGF